MVIPCEELYRVIDEVFSNFSRFEVQALKFNAELCRVVLCVEPPFPLAALSDHHFALERVERKFPAAENRVRKGDPDR